MPKNQQSDRSPVSVPYDGSLFPVIGLIESRVWASLSGSEAKVLAVIWRWSVKHSKSARMSQRTIASDAGVTESTVKRALATLADAGLVQIAGGRGPYETNSYRVNFADLSLRLKEPLKARERSPYDAPRLVTDVALLGGSESPTGEDRVHVQQRRPKTRHIQDPDGCVLFSRRESAVHPWLNVFKIPHLSNVRYSNLGVEGLHHNHSGDFMVAPGVILECPDPPGSAAASDRYERAMKRKEEFAKKAGVAVVPLSPFQKFTERTAKSIRGVWSRRSAEGAQRFMRRLEYLEVFAPVEAASDNRNHLRWKDARAYIRSALAGEAMPEPVSDLWSWSRNGELIEIAVADDTLFPCAGPPPANVRFKGEIKLVPETVDFPNPSEDEDASIDFDRIPDHEFRRMFVGDPAEDEFDDGDLDDLDFSDEDFGDADFEDMEFDDDEEIDLEL